MSDLNKLLKNTAGVERDEKENRYFIDDYEISAEWSECREVCHLSIGIINSMLDIKLSFSKLELFEFITALTHVLATNSNESVQDE